MDIKSFKQIKETVTSLLDSQKVVAFARLARLDRPIGIWLLLWPGWWALALALDRAAQLWMFLAFGVGAVLMRSAGCVLNDLIDRKLDVKVSRTKGRPLASGELSVNEAIGFLGALLIPAFLILLLFNNLTIMIGILALIPVAIYPFMKRWTWWPQVFLGVTFNLGALMGWTAATAGFDITAFFLYGACILWTIGYDTIYAHQDIEDDRTTGIKSTAIRFGSTSRLWIGLFYAGVIALFLLIGLIEVLNSAFYIALFAVAGLLAHQVASVKLEEPESCLKMFQLNKYIGVIIFMGLVLGQVRYF